MTDNQNRVNKYPIQGHPLGHRLINTKPDFDGCEFDQGKVVFGVLFEAGGDGSEVLEFVEEALDEIALAIEVGAEGRDVLAPRHGLDVRPSATILHYLAQGV